MYTRLRDNLISPKGLYERKNDKAGITVLYFFFLVVLLSIASVVQTISFKELSTNDKSEIKLLLSDNLDIPCSIDNGLICESDELHKVTYLNLSVFFDPAGEFVPSDLGVNVVLQSKEILVYSAGQNLFAMDYLGTSSVEPSWPEEWNHIDIDPDSSEFWDSFFLGLDSLIEEYRGYWVPVSIIFTIFAFAFVLFSEVLLDTLILSLFRMGGLKYGQMFKLVLNAATAYILVSVILDLYNIEIGYLMRSIMQLIPVIYVLLAIRAQRGEGNV